MEKCSLHEVKTWPPLTHPKEIGHVWCSIDPYLLCTKFYSLETISSPPEEEKHDMHLPHFKWYITIVGVYIVYTLWCECQCSLKLSSWRNTFISTLLDHMKNMPFISHILITLYYHHWCKIQAQRFMPFSHIKIVDITKTPIPKSF